MRHVPDSLGLVLLVGDVLGDAEEIFGLLLLVADDDPASSLGNTSWSVLPIMAWRETPRNCSPARFNRMKRKSLASLTKTTAGMCSMTASRNCPAPNSELSCSPGATETFRVAAGAIACSWPTKPALLWHLPSPGFFSSA